MRLLLALSLVATAHAVTPGPAGGSESGQPQRKLIFEFQASDLESFERDAKLARDLGATHVVITGGIPLANWEFDPPGDPYPAWFVHHASVLKIFPPKEVQPYVNRPYAEDAARFLEQRCKILRRYGLKAAWHANEPAVMPEAFFTAHPELRGPRIDQPNRSRIARFAPCVDHPETLRLYRESLKLLLQRCPEIEVFNFTTTDAGSGFCWAPGLYPGINGPAGCKNRPMEERVASFLLNWQQAARETGHNFEVNINQIPPRQWMVPTFGSPMAIVRLLPRGLAVNNLEGPDGRPFVHRTGSGWKGVFYPAVGIPVPPMGVPGARYADADAPRVWINFGEELAQDFNLGLYKATRDVRPKNEIEWLTALRRFAVTLAGEDGADDLLALWAALNDAKRGLSDLDFGPVLTMGHVLNRWITRPMVPFPEELTAEETSHYRPFLFQAKGDEQAANLIDIQGMRMYEGWGARMLFQRVIENVTPRMEEAIQITGRLAAKADDAKSRAQWQLLGKRLEAALCLIRCADHMVAYQAQLDRVKQLAVKPEPNPPLGTQSSWDRTDLMEIARKEIDNTVRLKQLIESTAEPLLDTAPTPAEESIMRLGPNLSAQLKRKIDIMNAHWADYDRLFTAPNP